MHWATGTGLILTLLGLFELWLAARLRRSAIEICAAANLLSEETAQHSLYLEGEVDRLGKISASLNEEFSQCVAALNQFVMLWNEGDKDRAVDVLADAGFNVKAS
jgi:hypothetical protein